MTERKSERRGSGAGTSGRPSASSLTDAVVAALAEVEKSRSEVPIPAEAKAAKPGETKREDTAPFERAAANKTDATKADAPKADVPAKPAESFSADKTL